MKIDDNDWNVLMTRIKAGTCTPFLGAAVNYGILPLGGEIARRWAADFDYPLDTRSDLAKVAQFLAIKYDPTHPKELITNALAQGQKPFDFNDDREPLNVLAKLPLPVYITTNYDDLLRAAIEHHGQAANRRPVTELCKWNRSPSFHPVYFKKGSKFVASAQTPVVFHLHGHRSAVDSLVLTEDDYLDFLVNISSGSALLPHRIQRALTGSSLLFIGYSLSDWTFRVLYRGLVSATEKSLRRISVTVQLPQLSEDDPEVGQNIQNYMEQYFGNTDMKVSWCTAREFCAELRQRWDDFSSKC